ncbi:MAG TPA: class I SAM-dependent methyltransferase [Puia sp.]
MNRQVDNQYSDTINSAQYWNQRFTADWKENNGIEQSQFFARIAVDNMPAWFIRYIEQHQPSFCDWGCAMGDGTKVLRDLLSLKNITGIDFSRVAIEQARSDYPAMNFIVKDILKDERFPSSDIIFSSNTLEHFENPWEILEKLSCFARKFIVLLIPFQEYHRHFEHFYTFEATNIPSTIHTSYYLTNFSIIKAAEYPSSCWNGHQILLIYSTWSEIARLGLTLSDLLDNMHLPPLKPNGADTINSMAAALTDCTENIHRLQEQLDLAFDLLNKRLDDTDLLMTKNISEKNALAMAITSLQNEMRTSLDSIKENLSHDFITTIKHSFSRLTRLKNKAPNAS